MKIVTCNKKWLGIFQNEKKLLKSILSTEVKAVEHIGSTAIPKMASKPIIDIVVLVTSIQNQKKFFKLLKTVGYTFDEKRSSAERLFFTKGKPATFHLSLTQKKFSYWERQIAFRNYLIAHPDYAKQYMKLKRKLIKKYPSGRGQYSYGKSGFVEMILSKSKA